MNLYTAIAIYAAAMTAANRSWSALSAPGGRDWCVGYMDASKHREPPSAGGPRVHEAPQGIGRG